jgi:serine/threonine-protein kinase HipA
MHDIYAGILRQDEDGYAFTYDNNYLKSDNSNAISLTLPLRAEPYRSKTIIPFFDGLIPEGWALETAVKNMEINTRDRMAILLAVCQDCTGAVSIVPLNEGNA